MGIDIGTSTTQLILSRLTLENRAAPFTVPRVAISDRQVLYRSDIHFTPLLSDTVIDAAGVRNIVAGEYRKSGFSPAQVDTGAVIITGETARKENAREVLSALSEFAGDFVVATAGPDLESILAARGAGADEYSKEHHTAVLHFDIGGGTSNLAKYAHGELLSTGCLDVGGRLIKLDPGGRVTYVSPVLARAGCPAPAVGELATPEGLAPVIQIMVEALEQAAGLRPGRDRLEAFLTQGTSWTAEAVPVVSFSGGVADCICHPPENWLTYGDIGVLLGRAIASSPAFQQVGRFQGAETIRATVVGAGSHATDLSGSTIFYRDITFPLKSLPILKLTAGRKPARRRNWRAHCGQTGLVRRPGGSDPAGPGPSGGAKSQLRPGAGAGPGCGPGVGASAPGGLCAHRGGGGRPGQGAGAGHGRPVSRPPALSGRGGGGQRGLYGHRGPGGRGHGIACCYQ